MEFKVGDLVEVTYEFDSDRACCPDCAGVAHICEAPSTFTVVKVDEKCVFYDESELGAEFWAVKKLTKLEKALK